MKKNLWIIIGIIVVIIILGVGSYALFYKPSKTATSTTQSQATPVNNSVVQTKTDSSIGSYLADLSGKALYTYGGDGSGVSKCIGACLVSWPAYIDTGATTGLPSGFGTIKRADNSQMQYTYNGMPLYYFASDGNGQVTGNGVGHFQVAKPGATMPISK